MAKTIKAWLLNSDGLGDDFYSAYDLVYRGRYSIQKLLTNNELKYAVTEEYSYRESASIRDRQYYVFISGTPDDMSLRYLYCTGYVYRFRSSEETNLLYETDVLLYVADNGKALSVLEIIPNEGVDSSEIPNTPPVPYDTLYSEDITGIEQSTIINFIVGNPFMSGDDRDDGTLLAIDSRYYFSSEEERDRYFASHPMELARSPLLAAVQSSGGSNVYDIYKYYHTEDKWEKINAALAGPRGRPGAHAVMLEGPTATLPPTDHGSTAASAYVKVEVVENWEASDEASYGDDSDDSPVAYRLSFGIPQGVRGTRGPRGHRPEIGTVTTNQVDYQYPANVIVTETLEVSDESDERSVLDFTFTIPQGETGPSPFVSRGFWYSYDATHTEYNTNVRARGATAPCPVISNGNWYVNQETGEYDSDGTPVFSWEDTDVRAYGNNFLIIDRPIYEGTNVFNIDTFVQSGYQADEVTLDSIVVSINSQTRNFYGQVTYIDETSGRKIVYVTYKGTARGDYSVRDFSSNNEYVQGALCMHDGTLYRANGSIAPGQFDPEDWEPVLSNDTVLMLRDFKPAGSGLLPLYRKDQAAVYSDALYRCIVHGFPGEYFSDGIFQYGFDINGPVIWWDRREFSAWEPDEYYSAGVFASYNGSIYHCVLDHLSDETFSAEEQNSWELCAVWTADTPYVRGNAVLYASVPYVCINDCTQSVFKADNLYWRPVRMPVPFNPSDPADELPDEGTYVYTSLESGQDNVYEVFYESTPINTNFADSDSSDSGEFSTVSKELVLRQVTDPAGNDVMMSDIWQASESYTVGQHVLYAGMLYYCVKDNALSEFSFYYELQDGLSLVWQQISSASGGSGTGTAYRAGAGINISSQTISLRPATSLAIGGVIPDGQTVRVTGNGVITALGGRSYMRPEVHWHYGIIGRVFSFPELADVVDPDVFHIYKNGLLQQCGPRADYDFDTSSHQVTFRDNVTATDKVAVECGFLSGSETYAAGYGIDIDNSGVISVDSSLVPTVVYGDGLSYSSGTVKVNPASYDSLGGIAVDSSTLVVDSAGIVSVRTPAVAFSGTDGIVINGSMISAAVDSSTIIVDNGVLKAIGGGSGGGIVYSGGDGINVSGSMITASIDSSTIVFSNGVLAAVGGGSGGIVYSGGDGINVSGSMITAAIDSSTIVFSNGVLAAASAEMAVPVSAVYSGNSGSEISVPRISGAQYFQIYRNGLLQMGSGADYSADTSSATVSFVAPLTVSETVAAVVYEGGSAAPGGGYIAGSGIVISGGVVSAKVDGATVDFDSNGALSCKVSGGSVVSTYFAGTGINIDNNNSINVLVDSSTIGFNNGVLSCMVSGGSAVSTYFAGAGIDIDRYNSINVLVDSSTIGFNNGVLSCMVSGGTVTGLYGSGGISVTSSGGSTFITADNSLLASNPQVASSGGKDTAISLNHSQAIISAHTSSRYTSSSVSRWGIMKLEALNGLIVSGVDVASSLIHPEYPPNSSFGEARINEEEFFYECGISGGSVYPMSTRLYVDGKGIQGHTEEGGVSFEVFSTVYDSSTSEVLSHVTETELVLNSYGAMIDAPAIGFFSGSSTHIASFSPDFIQLNAGGYTLEITSSGIFAISGNTSSALFQ